MFEIKNKRWWFVIFFITLCIASLIITVSIVAKNKIEEPEAWVLHSYGNNVALYNGENIVEVYGTIMIDTLPETDRKLLDNGIAFPTRKEAVNALEDYDG